MRWRAGGTRVVMVGVAILGAMSLLSCGGPASESVTGPSTAAITTASDSGAIAASGKGSAASALVLVCHKGKDLMVAGPAVSAHLRHGDRLGSCSAVCPCFTKEGIDLLAATCSVGLVAQCPVQYSLQLYCSPGPFSSNLGYFEAQLGTNSCVSITQDAVSGDLTRTEIAVSGAQYDACRAAIVTSTAYQSTSPTSCPR
jgi:hypothetical protein